MTGHIAAGLTGLATAISAASWQFCVKPDVPASNRAKSWSPRRRANTAAPAAT